jgi:hypothetical protein
MSNAKTLLPTARGQLTSAFRQGLADADLSEFLQPLELDRDLPLDDVRRLLERAMQSFEDPVASDAWLAPRLHAVLRLRRNEAAERGIWAWLATVEFPEYARWRFPGKSADEEEDESKRGTPLKRFLGSGRDNALARLWWGAELFRNGDDYEPVVRAFAKQDVPNTWLSLDAVHHPAAAQAALRLLPALGSKPINRLSTALDHVLTTIQLDVLAPVEAPDTIAADEWVAARADIDEILGDDLPRGPEETPVPEELVDAVEALLRSVAAEIQLPLPELEPQPQP